MRIDERCILTARYVKFHRKLGKLLYNYAYLWYNKYAKLCTGEQGRSAAVIRRGFFAFIQLNHSMEVLSYGYRS